LLYLALHHHALARSLVGLFSRWCRYIYVFTFLCVLYVGYIRHRRFLCVGSLSGGIGTSTGMTTDAFRRTPLHDILCSDYGPARSDLHFEVGRTSHKPPGADKSPGGFVGSNSRVALSMCGPLFPPSIPSLSLPRTFLSWLVTIARLNTRARPCFASVAPPTRTFQEVIYKQNTHSCCNYIYIGIYMYIYIYIYSSICCLGIFLSMWCGACRVVISKSDFVRLHCESFLLSDDL
jgi:hypothetical protein